MGLCRAGDKQLTFATPAEKENMPLEMQLWSERKLHCALLLLEIVRLEFIKQELQEQPKALSTMLHSRECSASVLVAPTCPA
jgi:hypothetical protein